MRRFGVGMTAAVLLAGLAASASSAQDMDGDLHSAAPKPKSWWDGWFAAPSKPVDNKPEAVVPPAPAAPSAAETATTARQRERDALDRRMEVCDRLMAVAVQSDNAAMQTQIDQLRERAWQLYQQRTANLPVGAPSSPGEAALDRRLGVAASGRPLPAPPTDGQPSLTREVKP